MSRKALIAAGGALVLASSLLLAGNPATARPSAPDRTQLADGLLSPLSLAVSKDGATRYFSQNFAGVLMKQTKGSEPEPAYVREDGSEVGAVSLRYGSVRFAITGDDSVDTKPSLRAAVEGGPFAKLMGLKADGTPYGIVNLAAYEEDHNPDGDQTYGFTQPLPEGCTLPEDAPPPSYDGIVESHPYATAQDSNGNTFVADAAANAIIKVTKSGVPSTVAVLPAKKVWISASFAEQVGFPPCTVGRAYKVEPVPTDVEFGPDGKLYVSTLPGGAEDDSLGANGSVYRINPSTGKILKVAGGLLTPTGIAVTPAGDVFVAEIFGGRIVRIPLGHDSAQLQTFVAADLPGDIEYNKFGMFATIDVLPTEGPPDGKVVRYSYTG